jgi:hypothetical protein
MLGRGSFNVVGATGAAAEEDAVSAERAELGDGAGGTGEATGLDLGGSGGFATVSIG